VEGFGCVNPVSEQWRCDVGPSQIRSHFLRAISRGQINSDRIPQARSGCPHCQKRPRRLLVQTGSPETMRAFFPFVGFGQKLSSKKFDAQKNTVYMPRVSRNSSAVVAFLLYVLFFCYRYICGLIKPGKLEAEFVARVKFFKK